MVNGYVQKYENEYITNFTTPTFIVPLHKFKLYYSPDLLADDLENNPWIIEIKTGQQTEVSNFQTMSYAWAKYKWDLKIPRGIIKRTIRKHGCN